MNPINLVADALSRAFNAAAEGDYVERDRLMDFGQSLMDKKPVRASITMEEQPDGSFAPPKQMSLDI